MSLPSLPPFGDLEGTFFMFAHAQRQNEENFVFPARKLPILVFSGDHNGELMKWERKQSNQFAYR